MTKDGNPPLKIGWVFLFYAERTGFLGKPKYFTFVREGGCGVWELR